MTSGFSQPAMAAMRRKRFFAEGNVQRFHGRLSLRVAFTSLHQPSLATCFLHAEEVYTIPHGDCGTHALLQRKGYNSEWRYKGKECCAATEHLGP